MLFGISEGIPAHPKNISIIGSSWPPCEPMRSGSPKAEQAQFSDICPEIGYRAAKFRKILSKYCPFFPPSQVDIERSIKLEAVTMISGSAVLVLEQHHSINNITK